MRRHLKEREGFSTSLEVDLCEACDNQNSPSDAHSRCLTCKKNLCEGCLHYHNKFTKDHKIVDISEISSHPSSLISLFRPAASNIDSCPLHVSQKKNALCLDCNRLTCPYCVINGDHKGHSASLLSEAIRDKKKQTVSLINDIGKQRQEIETSLHLIGLVETQIQVSRISQRDQIISFTDQLQQQIEQHKQTLLQQLEDKSKEKLDRLAQQRKQLERDLDCLDNSVSFSRSLLKNATDQQLVSHLPLITDQLNRLKEDKSFNQPPVETTHLEMSEDRPTESTSLLDHIKTIKLVEIISEDLVQAFMKTKRLLMNTRNIKTSAKRNYDLIQTPSLVFGSRGSNCGQYDRPKNVFVDHNNVLFVCDSENRRIQMLNENDQSFKELIINSRKKGERECIIAASVDFNNNIVMFGFDSHQIIIFDPVSNQIVRQFGGGKGQRNGEFDDPQSLCVDLSNRIIVCDSNNHRIQMFGHQGDHLLSFGSKGSKDGQFNKHSGVTVNHLNDIIVCDSNNHRIQMFDEDGNHLKSFGSKGSANGQFYWPQRVAVDHHNNILVSDWGNNRIQVFDPQGKWISSFGSGEQEKGQFDGPQGIAVDHLNRIIVTESKSSRVQIF